MKHRLITIMTLLLIAISALFIQDSELLTRICLSLGIVWLLVVSCGVLFLRFNYFVESQTTTGSDHVLLTFDDGPHPEHTTRILDTLEKHQIKALFFVVGRFAKEHPKIIERMIRDGHIIGNHTQNHPPLFALMPGKKVEQEIQLLKDYLKQHGIENPLFRPPIGYTNPIIGRVVKKMLLTTVAWNLRSYDTLLNRDRLLRRLKKKTQPGDIVLLHDNRGVTSEVLEEYILAAQENGIIFVSQASKIPWL